MLEVPLSIGSHPLGLQPEIAPNSPMWGCYRGTWVADGWQEAMISMRSSHLLWPNLRWLIVVLVAGILPTAQFSAAGVPVAAAGLSAGATLSILGGGKSFSIWEPSAADGFLAKAGARALGERRVLKAETEWLR